MSAAILKSGFLPLVLLMTQALLIRADDVLNATSSTADSSTADAASTESSLYDQVKSLTQGSYGAIGGLALIVIIVVIVLIVLYRRNKRMEATMQRQQRRASAQLTADNTPAVTGTTAADLYGVVVNQGAESEAPADGGVDSKSPGAAPIATAVTALAPQKALPARQQTPVKAVRRLSGSRPAGVVVAAPKHGGGPSQPPSPGVAVVVARRPSLKGNATLPVAPVSPAPGSAGRNRSRSHSVDRTNGTGK